jgi:nucleotide-binding universal stress UspA family protein
MRIVLATERTCFDAGAERLAIELARRAQARLHLVCPLVGNPEYQIVAPQRVAAEEAAARAALEALADQARAAGVPASIHVREGEDPWREIVDEACELQADLLVIRRVGKRGLLARLVVGEMVSQVAAHATVPVLMVADAPMWSHRVLAVIEPPADAAPVARVAVPLAALAQAPLAVSADESGALVVARVARERGVACERVADAGARDASFAQHVRQTGADLLVLGVAPAQLAHGRLSTAIEALIGAMPCPTVLVKS